MGTSVSIHSVEPFVRAGESVELELSIWTDEVLFIDRITIGLRIWEGTASKAARTQVITDLKHIVPKVTQLPVGPTSYRVTFPVPASCPPTHDTSPGFVLASATAVVETREPWHRWERSQPVVVRRMTETAFDRQPSLQSSPHGALAIHVAASRVAIGEPIVGWLRWSTPTDEPVTVTMQLVSTSQVPVGNDWDSGGRERRVVIPSGSHDRAIPFVFDPPTDLPPTFKSASHTRAYRLDVKGPGEALRVPIELLDAPVPTTAHPAPGLGTEHLETSFASLATTGWAPVPTPLALSVHGTVWPAVGRTEGPCDIVLGVGHQPGQGTRIVAQVTTPSLGLGLRVTPSSPLRELFSGDIEAGVPAWDKRYRVTARNEVGAAAHLAAFVPGFATLPPVVAWDDRELVFAQPNAWITPDELKTLAAELIRVARAHGPQAPAAGPYR